MGDWLIKPSLNRVCRGAEIFRLRPQLMDLLVCLATRAGRTVTKDEIFDAVWPGQYIVESGLARCVAELRQILGDRAGHDSLYIETITKRGYRVIAPVAFLSPTDGEAPPATGEMAPPAAADVLPEAGVQAPATVAAGAEPADPPGVPASRAGHRRWQASRWRMAVAAAAVAALAAAVCIGRFLWPTPLLGERDTLVLVFHNLTGEAVFDETLRLALKIQLEQSPYLRIVSDERVREELAFMNRPADAVVTRDVAREVCQRVGAKALVAGTVASLGRHYAVGLEGISCQSGDTLLRRQVDVENREAVLGGLGRAVASLRRRLGESVASIRRSEVPIAQATTPSLDALKAFSLGDLARSRGDDDGAVAFYRRAIELDPSFALAHVRLGLHLINLSRLGEGLVELKAAYAVRHRASAGERLYITACYQNRVLRDPLKALESLVAWRQAFPRNAVARFTLASMYNQVGRQQEASVEAREALALEPNGVVPGTVLSQALVQLGEVDAASRLVDQLIERHPSSALLHGVRLDIDFLRGDRAMVRRQLEWANAAPAAAPLFADLESGMALFAGRLSEAARRADRNASLARQRDDATLASAVRLAFLSQAAMLGAIRDPTAQVESALRIGRTPELVANAALALAWASQADAAERYLREYESMPDVAPGSDARSKLCARALVALAHGQPQTAVDVLAPLRPYEYGWRFGFEPTYVRGLALLRLGRLADATAEFERIVNRRGIVVYGAVYPLALLQLGRTRALAGDVRGSRDAYDRALRCWQEADPDVPVIAQATRELQALPRTA